MIKFILKTFFFIAPFIALYTINKCFYSQEEGDLVRIGYLYANPSPKSKLLSQYQLPKCYTLLSEIDLSANRKFEVITIGDSFSEQDSLGYNNFLAHKGASVLHVDGFVSGGNPIQTLIQLINSDFFDHVNTDYVVLQSVERLFLQRIQEIDFTLSTDLDSISNRVTNHQAKLLELKKSPNYNLKFFSDATLKIPLTNIQYLVRSKPAYSKTFKLKSEAVNLFDNNPGDLLIYQDDIKTLDLKNDSSKVLESVEVLNSVNDLASKKNIKLIVVISPDKYDLYYKFIQLNERLPRPLFFPMYEKAGKGYINIDTYQVLSEKISKKKNVYYYDDTHWSPVGANIIADEIFSVMKKASVNVQ